MLHGRQDRVRDPVLFFSCARREPAGSPRRQTQAAKPRRHPCKPSSLTISTHYPDEPYFDFLRWNVKHLREVQLVVSAATWPRSDWQRTTTVRPEQPWTVLAHFHASAAEVAASTEPVHRVPANGGRGYSIHLDHPQPCDAATLRHCLTACLSHDPACLAFRPLHWLVDNPGSAKLPPDLHTWPLFNMVDALHPRGQLVLTNTGEALVETLGTGG